MRGESWWLWGALLLLAALLASLRSAFYRDARLIREPLSDEALVPLVAVAVCGITLALVAYGGGGSRTRAGGRSCSSRDAPDSLRFTVGLTGVLLLVGMARLLRPARLGVAAWDDGARRRLRALGALAPVQADGAVFGEKERAGFAFLKRDRVWLALGDPAGERGDAISAIWRFRDACERAGVDPAFWRVGPDLLRVYGDIGLTAVPLAAPGDGSAALPGLPGRARPAGAAPAAAARPAARNAARAGAEAGGGAGLDAPLPPGTESAERWSGPSRAPGARAFSARQRLARKARACSTSGRPASARGAISSSCA